MILETRLQNFAMTRVQYFSNQIRFQTRTWKLWQNPECCKRINYVLWSNNWVDSQRADEETLYQCVHMNSAGMTTSVEERMMDAVTGLSGSGPAYVFLIIEAMADGAVSAGLPRDKALALAAQTVAGASRMVTFKLILLKPRSLSWLKDYFDHCKVDALFVIDCIWAQYECLAQWDVAKPFACDAQCCADEWLPLGDLLLYMTFQTRTVV